MILLVSTTSKNITQTLLVHTNQSRAEWPTNHALNRAKFDLLSMFRTLLLSALFIAASATNLRTEGRSTGHNHEGESLQHSGWSLLSEKGENVLAEQSTSRRYDIYYFICGHDLSTFIWLFRLTAYRNLHLKFEALNLRFGVRLDQASSVFHDETIVTVHSKVRASLDYTQRTFVVL